MAEMLGLSVHRLVVRCLVFAAVQAETMARGNAGAICSTGAASSALTPPVRFRLSLLRARGSLGGTE